MFPFRRACLSPCRCPRFVDAAIAQLRPRFEGASLSPNEARSMHLRNATLLILLVSLFLAAAAAAAAANGFSFLFFFIVFQKIRRREPSIFL